MSRLDVTATRVWNDGFTTTDHSTHEWPNHTAKEAATERAARLHSAGQSVTRHDTPCTVTDPIPNWEDLLESRGTWQGEP